MMQKPFFTVIVPTFNCGSYLEATLDSLLAQTDPEWEAIVVHDGAVDITRDVIREYRKRDARIRGSHKECCNVASSLNVGLEHAKGSWICRLNSGDLFDISTLEQYRDSIVKAPQCSFFFSGIRYLQEASELVTNSPLFQDIPQKCWQILEMFRGSFIHGNCICINREAWLRVGLFDENLRYGQDYDMWLRLLAHYPATFIPERTCVARWHTAQTTNDFPEAGVFDSAKAAINFLNHHPFSDLVPLVDLDDPSAALATLTRAMEIVESADNPFLYSLGPHFSLLLRILEWVWGITDDRLASTSRRLVRNRANYASRKYERTPFGLLWKATSVALGLPQCSFAYEPVSPIDVAERYCWHLEAHGDGRAKKLRRYLGQSENGQRSFSAFSNAHKVNEVIFVNQLGMTIGTSVAYGTLRATLERAKYLMRSGVSVVIVAVSDSGIKTCDGVLIVGARSEDALLQALRLWGPTDTVIGISRGDFLTKVRAKRVAIYHHGTHAVQGLAIDKVLTNLLNRARVHVFCVSKFSRDWMVGLGVRAELVHVVPNGVDTGRFTCKTNYLRPAQSLIFAGHIVDYKGIDIALRAFAVLKSRFPDSVFDAYGGYLTWRGRPNGWAADADHVFAPGWLGEDGFPVWSAIERELPGFHYHGEVSQDTLARAFRTHSILIMPSRIAETFGLVSLEAQAVGCIPVLPRQGAFSETMRVGITGYLYETNTVEALAAKITDLWEKHLPLEKQRAEAQAWVREALSWENSGNDFLRLIESIPISARSRCYRWLLYLDLGYWRWIVARIYYGLLRRAGSLRYALGSHEETKG